MIKMKWSKRNKTHYISKGYVFTKFEDEFKVKIEDLTDGTDILIDIQCDSCGKILKDIPWNRYKKYSSNHNGKYYCYNCAIKLFGLENSRKIRLKNSKSFKQWCYENLMYENADKIMLRWDYDLNKINPEDISYSSHGFNKKGYWFKCLDHPEHRSEQKNLSDFVNGHNGSIICNQCNSIAVTHPHLAKYLVNKDDTLKYTMGSGKNIPMKCPDCGYEKSIRIPNLIREGFSCPRCSDGVSYPEKFIFNILEQLNVNFIIQLNKNIFKWCRKYRFDNYIKDINCIIETHGLQHYEESGIKWRMSLTEIQENDRLKEQLAKENSIKNYIILDCRKSELEWIKNSMMNSELPTLLGFKEEDIDWLKCHEFACNSLIKIACDLWMNKNSVLKIAEILKINRNTVTKYLKQGAKLKWCDYNPKEELVKIGKNLSKNQRRIICLTTGEIFKSIKEATTKYNIDQAGISRCCMSKVNSAGKHSETNKKLVWMFYDEYIKGV